MVKDEKELVQIIVDAILREDIEKLEQILNENKAIATEDWKKVHYQEIFFKVRTKYYWNDKGYNYNYIIQTLLDTKFLSQDDLNDFMLDAVYGKDGKLFDCLIANGADINYSKDGETALLIAIKNYSPYYFNMLENVIEKGADLNKGEPIKVAIKLGKTRAIRELIDAGAECPEQLKEVVSDDGRKIYRKAKVLPKEYRKLFSANKTLYGYKSLPTKIHETVKNINSSDVVFGGVITVLGGMVIALGGILAHAINMPIVYSNLDKANAELEEKRAQLSTSIADQVDISNFDIASVELAQGEGDYILKAFGSTSVEKIVGLKENNYLNVFFNISPEHAQNIMAAVANAETTERLQSYNSPEHAISIGNTDSWLFMESGRIDKTSNACVAVYDALNNAVNNAYASRVEEVSEASAMNSSISREYRYTRPEVVGDTNVSGWVGHGSTAFLNAGIVTTGVSQVVRDEENGVSFFIIDTLQGRAVDGNMVVESCRARVEVEGTDLTQEEVYAKFINGDHSKFTEIIREKVGSKAGVVNNQMREGVEEIEFF